MSARRGFTLIELLVASGIFLVGFSAAFALFLRGARDRALAESITRTGLATSSLLAELRLRSGLGLPSDPTIDPPPPSAYIGDGDPANGAEGDGAFFPVDGSPGCWFRVATCTDVHGGDEPGSDVLRLDLLVAWTPTPLTSLSQTELIRRAGLNNVDEDEALEQLARRGVLRRQAALILRRLP